MTAVKIIVAILNLAMALVFFLCGRELSWDNQDDRTTIVGFWFMIVLNLVNAILVAS